MGSVISSDKCKMCGGIRNVDFYYKRGVEHSLCMRCGFTSDITPNNSLEEVGYGIISIWHKGQMGGLLIPLKEPITNKVIKDMELEFKDDSIDMKKSFVSSYQNGKLRLVLGLGIPDDNCKLFSELKENEEGI